MEGPKGNILERTIITDPNFTVERRDYRSSVLYIFVADLSK
jgi:hypothetical protein